MYKKGLGDEVVSCPCKEQMATLFEQCSVGKDELNRLQLVARIDLNIVDGWILHVIQFASVEIPFLFNLPIL